MASRLRAAQELQEFIRAELDKVVETEGAKEAIIIEQEQEISRLTKAVTDMSTITVLQKATPETLAMVRCY